VALSVLSSIKLKIDTEDDVVVVRRRVRALAMERGFDSFSSAAVTTATSELTRNVWVHARGGFAVIEEVSEGERLGLRVRFEDRGPGVPNIERVLAGGYSTAKSLGLGVSGSRRLVDEFSIESTVGEGTVVTFTKWKRF
jgi:serine/threonine-protein kinase RsbT